MNSRPNVQQFAAVLAACAISGSVFAQDPEGPVAAIQQSLKRQQYYSGEVSGKYDEATKGAVRRFQIRQGLKVSGELDAATLEALAAVEKSAPVENNTAPSQTAEPVPARERSRQLARSDQEFLAELEGDEEPAPIAAPPEPRRPEPTRPSEEVKRPSTPQAEVPKERQDAPPPPSERIVTRREREEEVTSSPPRSKEREVSPADARRFVESYLTAAQGPTPEREVSFYADRVNYFDSGRVNKDAVERDQRAYYRKWPKRDFELVDEPEVLKTTADEATVRFRIRYNVSKGDQTARGRTENVVRLRQTDDGLKIVAIRERKLD